jgi:hypothetical protein
MNHHRAFVPHAHRRQRLPSGAQQRAVEKLRRAGRAKAMETFSAKRVFQETILGDTMTRYRNVTSVNNIRWFRSNS